MVVGLVVKRDEYSVAIERKIWSQVSHLNQSLTFLSLSFTCKIKLIIALTLDSILNDIIHIKPLDQSPAHGKSSVNILKLTVLCHYNVAIKLDS